jgi:hypothetical protein
LGLEVGTTTLEKRAATEFSDTTAFHA